MTARRDHCTFAQRMVRPVDNPPNPWHATHIEWEGEAPDAKLELFEERARSILSENDSPDVPHRWSVNPYRGCLHACFYCYARPSHQQLGFGAGTDFDRKIVVKTNAAELLREHFDRRSWTGELVMFSGNTDCYQPIEGTYALTRACLEVCADYRNPVAIVTKGTLVRRDVDVLTRLANDGCATVIVSIPYADDATRKKVEPWASSVAQRFETLRILSEAGIPTGVMIAPIIPGLNDDDVAEVLTRAHAAGARRAGMQLVRLPGEVSDIFDARMREAFPDRAKRIDSALLQVRRGKRNESEFGARMKGTGARWEIIRQLFATTCRRLGMNTADPPERKTFRRPTAQLGLFDDE